jgi:SpoIID/LytB domain protein
MSLHSGKDVIRRCPALLVAMCMIATSLLTTGLMTTALIATSASPAGAQTATPMIEITGRGWGHGRGLGQYGALGYAQRGWSSGRILDHFYGGTTAAQIPPNAPVNPNSVRVELRNMIGLATTVGLESGTIVIKAADGREIGRVATGAVRLRRSGDGYRVERASSCAGPWEVDGTLGGQATLHLSADTSATGANGLLHTCGTTRRTWYRGEINAAHSGGQPRTINVVSIGDYLAGVVPNEVPASWPAAALEAQAVAARSYAMAGDTRQQPYADTCDTTRCQVYDGVYTERGGSFRRATNPRTDAAIAATSGSIRRTGSGAIARTEFSSSTGGYTAGGDFPAVVDEGDSVAANPNHTWRVTVPASKLENRYKRGKLLGIEVTERNGLGADGGRVLRVTLEFERGEVSESGDAIRQILGLKSNWFTPVGTFAGDRRDTPEGRYIDKTYQTLAGRAASDAELDEWYRAVASGNRRGLTNSLVVSDYFVGELLDDLYETALGRGPDAGGRAYWIGEVRKGLKLQAVGVLFYGSQEYYDRSGGTDSSFVRALYRDILHRDSDPGGQQYWEDRLADGSARFDDVAAGFYSSLESRRDRTVRLHERVLGPVPNGTVRDALAERLLSVDDLGLAAEIAASKEAFDAAG